jgi:translocation and assembly module TamB
VSGASGVSGSSGGGSSAPTPPAGGRRRRARRWWLTSLVVVALLIILPIAALFIAARTERGTRLAWDTAIKLSAGHLAGRYMGGTLERGIKLEDVVWRTPDDLIQIDYLNGQWALTRAPWRFTVDFLHLGTLDLKLATSSSGAPAQLPTSLTLPLQLEIRSVRIDHLRWRSGKSAAALGGKSVAALGGTSVTALDRIALSARSDGTHHALALDSLHTEYGSLSGSLDLDGVRPFKLSGALGFAGQLASDPVKMSARFGGSLEQLSADVDASGKQLNGRAHLEAMPFEAVPFKFITLAADHVDLRAFAPGAPAADLSLRARLAPVSGDASAAARGKPDPAHAPGLTVEGPISIVNAHPGALTAQLLPLVDASANVRLDAHAQVIEGLQVRLFQGGTLQGAGQFGAGKGQLDLNVAGLDLHLLAARIRPTRLGGALKVSSQPDSQHLTLDLADPKAALRVQAAMRFEPAQTTLETVRLTAGAGRVDLTGTLKHDAADTYALKTTLTDFNPFAILVQGPPGSGPPHVRGREGPTATPVEARRATGAEPGAGLDAELKPLPVKPRVADSRAPVVARINGTLEATGALSPALSTKATLTLRDSVYDGLPLTGGGVVQLAGERLLPSRLKLSVAGNEVDLSGGFGGPGDRLAFHIDAPNVDRLGFGLAGTVHADGTVQGNLIHPNIAATYSADALAFGAYRLGHAQGGAELRDGANGALSLNLDARDLSAPNLSLTTVSATLAGTRASHTLVVHAAGAVASRPVDLDLAARGKLTDKSGSTGWDGTLTQLVNRGFPALQLGAPVQLSVASQHVSIGAANLTVEGASLVLQQFVLDRGKLQTAGSVRGVDVDRMLRIGQQITGAAPPFKTDLILDGDWNVSVADTASGYVQLTRRSGDVTLSTWRGASPLGFNALQARAEFSAGNRVTLKIGAEADRIGTLNAELHSALSLRDGTLVLADDAPLSGTVSGEVPQLRTTGGLLGPTYILDGKLQLQLQVAGQLARPKFSGLISGNDLSATLIDQGIQFKQGVVRIALADNLVQFQQVEFHGESGTVRASGQIKLDEANANLAVNVVADKLELFSTPDRQLQLSGQATVRNEGAGGGIAIDGKFLVDHALFDLPESPAPSLGSDVHIVTQDGTEQLAKKPELPSSKKPAGTFSPHANIAIDLGNKFRFRGAGADLTLRGQLEATSKPGEPLRAVGNITVAPGSTYTAFGRKLAIDNGYFTFNGPIDNPGINILAMRHNQEVEAGVQVTGTLQAPIARLTSEPSVADNEKLSWLLFGHGTDQGSTVGQQSTVSQAFALLGSAGGKRVAKTLGLDEFTVGQSEVGLTDPQVVMLSKALNERIVLGYEQGLTTAASVFKATLNLSRFWAVAIHTGALNGATLLYNRRFD